MALPGLTLAKAIELYPDAHAYIKGDKLFLPPEHEIRQLAVAIYQKGTISTLTAVCLEIFHEIAQDAMRSKVVALNIDGRTIAKALIDTAKEEDLL